MFNPIDSTLEMSLNVFITPPEGITSEILELEVIDGRFKLNVSC